MIKMTTISFTNGSVTFSDEEIKKITKYFELIDNVLQDTPTHNIPIDVVDLHKETFLEMVRECDALQLDANKHLMYGYFGCRIPIGIPRENMYTHAIGTDNRALLEILCASGHEPTYDACECAIISGKVEFLRLMLVCFPTLVRARHRCTGRLLLEEAASCGNFQYLKMLHDMGSRITNKACVLAYGADSLECFKYTFEVLGKCDFGSGTFVLRPNCAEYYRKYVQQMD